MNHFAQVCKSSRTQRRQASQNVNVVDDEEDATEDWEVHAVMQTQHQNEIHCTATINARNIRLKIDTGAKCNVLPLSHFQKVKATENINKSKAVTLVAYGGDRFSTLGTVDLHCRIGDTMQMITFQVIDRLTTPILGLNDALRLQLIELDKSVYELKNEDETQLHAQITTEFRDLFDDDQLGTLPPKYVMRVDPTVAPVVKRARKIPQAMETKVKEELENMIMKGVIVRETKPTEWVSQMVATKKKKW
ncbi:hypothetical protein V1264_005875 [Littorina saxatilis]|uniref:Peptidase A2 domain-containing protein n=1 Tax=Littorina saxatilis TaxID=31220 RepID=A0AAN9B0I5_9CAEN